MQTLLCLKKLQCQFKKKKWFKSTIDILLNDEFGYSLKLKDNFQIISSFFNHCIYAYMFYHIVPIFCP